ncbi:ATP-dependent Clp protease proteolytic subunit 1 [Pseudomonas sp. 31 R 17]|uniref:head maturation protease, ClpP-related n=1 Tax=Pseudomonas sp. 31 R 17 TaxID=1844101 RepID=UPI0008128D5C|nr:head maturation protease, ClpP-related [Pseudomonas sp. 31 R 17]CRM71121.1 ATP-dependent Clp protease proteolytic subunit 1 [Pseudomonas sp. 31 R 17]
MPKSIKANSMRCEITPRALEMWNPGIQAALEADTDTITIYGIIGEDWWGEGNTVKRVDAALRAIGDNPVTVYINSPGGDMFEGIAIYNRLMEHSQEVTTKVLGLAASAASVVAMAGAKREIAKSAFLMIHNCWTYFAGNRHAIRELADTMEEFDQAMVGVYAETSGQDENDVEKMLDAETYLNGTTALEKGFATGLISPAEVKETADESRAQAQAARKLDAALAKSGMPRSERRKLISEIKTGMPSAAGGDTPRAVVPGKPRAALDVSAFEETATQASALRDLLPIR